ncbi:hypothetical protein EV424DRAFT_1347960 [Suillus variegatus]|nr:hypothetical protein EV424DRAFT_1347960 [Suillus variegatus]
MADTVLCTKADCRNLKQGTQPRKANKNCIRCNCKQCFEVAGGCRVHRVTAASSLVATQQHENSIIPPLATINPTSTQLDHPLVTTSNSSSASASRSLATSTQSLLATSRNYARPLDPNYARNYVFGHQRTLVAEQHFQADQSLSIMIRNMIDVVLWLKNNEPPHLIKLMCTTPGKFVPGDHPLLMRFELGDYIAVYCSDQHTWIEQDIKTPLLSPPNSTILLRSIDLTDNHMLLGFAKRVLSLSCAPETVQSPSKRSFSATDTSPVVVPAPAMVQPNTTIPADDQMIQALFATTFPNCTYTKATFYKHRTAYRAAIENSSDRVEHAVNAGYSPAGQWNTLLAEIKANAAPSLTGSNGLGSISNSDMKCMSYPTSESTNELIYH